MLPVCSACGQENPEGARFCNSCGAPLGAEHDAAREERKVVTVFFADLVGFTSRSDQLDPEDVRGMFSPYYARLRGAEALVAAGRRADADEQLQRALAFYRSVGATAYIREAEALFAATA
jgi:hypothetical protein